jgi:hypothetical protein
VAAGYGVMAPALRERGHVVTTPTLTGLGERRHSENRTATLSTHIEDIVAHIEMEDFQDVTLVVALHLNRRLLM